MAQNNSDITMTQRTRSANAKTCCSEVKDTIRNMQKHKDILSSRVHNTTCCALLKHFNPNTSMLVKTHPPDGYDSYTIPVYLCYPKSHLVTRSSRPSSPSGENWTVTLGNLRWPLPWIPSSSFSITSAQVRFYILYIAQLQWLNLTHQP
jgi:hypothetical protein